MSEPKPRSTLFLSLDLEMEQPSQEIIQVGAVIGDILTGEVVHHFSQLVTPKEPLSPFIIQLTGITQSDMDRLGVPIIDAYGALLEDISHYPTLNTNMMTWGGGDSKELQEQVKAANMKTSKCVETPSFSSWLTELPEHINWPFGRRWLDVKTIFQFQMMAKGLKPQAGLAKAMTKLGMNFKGRKHNALCDAHNTFLLAHKLLTLMKESK